MRKYLIFMAAASVFFQVGCSGKLVPRSAEEIRMEKIARIDTTSLRTVIDPDTIAGCEQLGDLSAEAWILVEDSTGMVISQKNADKRMFMASLTKMMTCLLALESEKLSDSIDITQEVCPLRDSHIRPGDAFLMSAPAAPAPCP